MKNAFCLMLNDDYILPFKIFLKSLYMHNPQFINWPIYIIDRNLSNDSITEIKSLCKEAIFVKIDMDSYTKVDIKSALYKYLQDTYYKIEAWRIEEPEYLILIDCDMLVLKPFDIDFDNLGQETWACLDDAKGNFNTGLVIIPKSHRTGEHYNRLLEVAESKPSLPDQYPYNVVFKGMIKRLKQTHNVTKGYSISNPIKKEHVIMYHYAGIGKPWLEEQNTWGNFIYQKFRKENNI